MCVLYVKSHIAVIILQQQPLKANMNHELKGLVNSKALKSIERSGNIYHADQQSAAQAEFLFKYTEPNANI